MYKNKIKSGMTHAISILFSLFLLGSLNGCMFYYKVQSMKPVEPLVIHQYDSLNKFLIIHQRDSAWHLINPVIKSNTLSGELTPLPENRWKFLTTKPAGGNRYIKNKKLNESYVLEEVHLYITDSVVNERYHNGNIKIAFSSIKNVEVYQKAKGRTNASWLVPAIVGPILAGGIVAIIAGSTLNNGGLMGDDFHLDFKK